MVTSTTTHIIGGGLAGSEAAWQLAKRDIPVTVVRADDHLYDEERFCAAVAFEKPMRICEELKKLQSKITNLIAA